MKELKRYCPIMIPWGGFFLFGASLLTIAVTRSEPWGDEVHYLETVKQMAGNLSWHSFVHYPEVNGPLSFFCYALWGKLFGFDLYKLRILTIIFTSIGLISFYFLVNKQVSHWLITALLISSVYLTPYVYGMSLFVFPDALAFCCITLAVSGFINKNRIVFTLASAAMLITKQYAVFVACALGGNALINRWIFNKKTDTIFFVLSIISAIPLAVLMIVWKGVSPIEGIQVWDAAPDVGFHPSYLVAYLAIVVVYAAPANLVSLLQFRFRIWMIPMPIVALGLYALAPIHPSRVTLVQTDFSTIGFFHRLLVHLIDQEFIIHGVFSILFCIGLYMFMRICYDLYCQLKHPTAPSFILTYDLLIIAFFCVLPFSFHVWEKYVIFVLPFWVVRQTFFNKRYLSPMEASTPNMTLGHSIRSF